jgi:glycerol-3-phosphate acyltransferase PlsY
VAILGHGVSPFAGFKGGKGIATSFGVGLVLEPYPTLIAFGIFLAVFFVSRIVSLGSIAAAAVFPWAVIFFEYRSPGPMSKTLVIFSFVVCVLVIWRHRTNIHRLQKGTEKPLEPPPEDSGQQKG